MLIPVLGYFGCALASIACYLVMAGLCYYYGQKYYPIPYNFKPSLLYLMVAAALIYLSFQFQFSTFALRSTFNALLALLFAVAMFYTEKKSIPYHRV